MPSLKYTNRTGENKNYFQKFFKFCEINFNSLEPEIY